MPVINRFGHMFHVPPLVLWASSLPWSNGPLNTYLCTPDLITYQIYLCVQKYISVCTHPPPSLLTMTEMNQDELIQELPSLRCELSWHFNIYGHLLLPKLLNMHCTSSSPQWRQIKWESLTYLESTVYTFQMYL